MDTKIQTKEEKYYIGFYQNKKKFLLIKDASKSMNRKTTIWETTYS